LHFLQGGWLCDRSGSYDMVWWPGAALGVMAAFVHWLMNDKPVQRLAAENG
jgi:nitrate/nitrite transporter NarK